MSQGFYTFFTLFYTFLYFCIVFLKVSVESIAPVSQINASQCLLQVVKGFLQGVKGWKSLLKLRAWFPTLNYLKKSFWSIDFTLFTLCHKDSTLFLHFFTLFSKSLKSYKKWQKLEKLKIRERGLTVKNFWTLRLLLQLL